jgi:hypothetical protein
MILFHAMTYVFGIQQNTNNQKSFSLHKFENF